MSWLKSTISKVQEKAEVIKNSQTLQKLQERTKRLGKSGAAKDAAELEAQLESKAKAAKSSAAIAELHKGWLQQLAAKDCYACDAVSRDLTFKEVLLKSRALELSVETILLESSLRDSFATEDDRPADSESPAGVLSAILSQTLLAPQDLWSKILKWGIAAAASSSQDASRSTWLSSAITAMKMDWQEEMLLSERKELALRSEFLRQEIKAGEGDPSDEVQRNRVASSVELLQTVLAVQKNLAAAKERRQEMLGTRTSQLSLIAEQVQSRIVSLQSSAQLSGQNFKQLEGELQQSQESIQLQLEHMGETRKSIDKEVEELEERKRQLRAELDEVSAKLDDARTRQRQQMERCDKERAELDAVKSNYKQQLETEESALHGAEEEHSVVKQAGELVQETDRMIHSALETQLTELSKKQQQFQEHIREVLQEHLKLEMDGLQKLKEAVSRHTSSESKAESDSSSLEKNLADGSANMEAFASICAELTEKPDAALQEGLEQLKAAYAELCRLVHPEGKPPAAETQTPAASAAPPAKEPAAADAPPAASSSAGAETAPSSDSTPAAAAAAPADPPAPPSPGSAAAAAAAAAIKKEVQELQMDSSGIDSEPLGEAAAAPAPAAEAPAAPAGEAASEEAAASPS